MHNVDGDLTPRIDACTPGYRFATHGLSACLIDTGILGNHSLTFFLSTPTLTVTSTTATRTLVVHPACPSSEQLCADHSCSSSGFCFGSTTAARADNAPPQLQFNAGEQSTVYVPRGTSYSFCNTTLDLSDPLAAGSTPAGRLCESGPVAFDEEDGILSHRVLACPPADCVFFGCPGHELRSMGLAGCGVDTEGAPLAPRSMCPSLCSIPAAPLPQPPFSGPSPSSLHVPHLRLTALIAQFSVRKVHAASGMRRWSQSPSTAHRSSR